ncbi:hypothetical protein Scep_023634 [Stephania cephalantha]|uniref:N-acetyltransferase domain-containing protein n=1 Tax=Stephania cephalantha TaxID=152367 RepID=A0AAP0EVJ1_9MAGN
MSSRLAIDHGEGMVATIREYEEGRDREVVEKLDRLCEFGNATDGNPSILTDLMGDPIARVRHYPSYVVLVAEIEEDEMTMRKNKGIVGVVSGCIKSVSKGSNPITNLPTYVQVAYILGLRVSPFHRRQGLAKKLVTELEQWCKRRGAQYAYMATDSTNQASINLFTLKCAYTKLRTPTVLVNPVHAHHKSIDSRVRIVRLEPRFAEFVYRHRVFGANTKFFPKDINTILSSKLNLGTYMAVPSTQSESDPLSFPPSFAILSVWNTKDVFKLQVKGVSGLSYAVCVGSRVLDTWLPWLRIPSIPDVFRPFGVYFLYGLHVEGSGGPALMKSLCAFVHNMAGDDVGCGAVVAEVDRMDEMKLDWVPHWRRFSWTDLWCMKKLTAADQDECVEDDWVESRPSRTSVFTDPRDF